MSDDIKNNNLTTKSLTFEIDDIDHNIDSNTRIYKWKNYREEMLNFKNLDSSIVNTSSFLLEQLNLIKLKFEDLNVNVFSNENFFNPYFDDYEIDEISEEVDKIIQKISANEAISIKNYKKEINESIAKLNSKKNNSFINNKHFIDLKNKNELNLDATYETTTKIFVKKVRI